MTERIEAPGYRHGDPVTVDGLPLKFVEQTDVWVEAVPPDSQVGFTVHESEIHL